jgi:hypothetical protein
MNERPATDALPDGSRLRPGETLVRTSKDWGISAQRLALTSSRLILPSDPTGRNAESLFLTEIREVRLQKNKIAFATIIVETMDGRKFIIPAHINGARIRDEIAAAVLGAKPPEVATPSLASDKYDQLRKLGELKASGVLSEVEFEREKARILAQP